MQQTNLLGNYISTTTTEIVKGKPRETVHNYRMTPAEVAREDWEGHTLKSMRSPLFQLGDLIDPITATILRAFAAQR